jgi:3-hydroxybutyryl-CoA dehydrogenase
LKSLAIIGAGPLGRWLAQEAARAGFRVALEDVMPGNLRRAEEELGEKFGKTSICNSIDIPGLRIETWGTQRIDNPGPNTRTWGTHDDDPSNESESGGEISFVSTIEDAVREADLAIDCVPDELESKLEIFCLLDRMAPPRTVLMTPTTQLSIADLASCTYRADKCVSIVAEPAQLAESAGREVLLRTTSRTAPETIETVREFWERMGVAVWMERDPRE